MLRNFIAGAGAALMLASFVAPAAHAISSGNLESARAKARSGERLTPHERELLNKHGTGAKYRGNEHMRRNY